MKRIFIPLLALIFASCGQPQNTVTVNQNPSAISVDASNIPGFSVTNFAQLLKTTKDPQTLEQAINAPNNNINNLDLNKDGQVDYLKVVENQGGTFQVVDDYSNTQSSVIATMTVNQQTNTMNINGNQAYCGNNYNYSSHFTVGDYLLLSYLLRPHSYYVPSYHYGYYPPTYRKTVVKTTYVTKTPNKTLTPAVPQRASISDPNKSQKSFTVTDQNKAVKSGGFGKPASTPTTTYKPATTARSFGTGRSGFGGGGRRK